MEGDTVALEIYPEDKWAALKVKETDKLETVDDESIDSEDEHDEILVTGSALPGEDSDDEAAAKKRPTGKVVSILDRPDKSHVGTMMHKIGDRFAQFYPADKRVTKMLVPLNTCPDDFEARFEDHYKNVCFMVKFLKWRESSYLPLGSVTKVLGTAGEINTENFVIINKHNIDDSEFEADIIDGIQDKFIVEEEELKVRRDLRSWRIFTIDPATAKDLDDALSCRVLEDGNFEMGVHIADVTHYLRPNTALDEIARKRATSVCVVTCINIRFI